MSEVLRACTNPLCERAVRATIHGVRRAAYCCGACGDAHGGRYEVHEAGPFAHSPGCDARHERRAGTRVRFPR